MKHERLLPWILCAAVLLLAGCSGAKVLPAGPVETPQPPESTPAVTPAPAEPTAQPAPTQPPEETDAAAALLQEMTLREKVGQLFIVCPDALDFTQTPETINDTRARGVTALTDAMQAALQDYPAGGILFFGKNLTGPEQITTFNAQLQQSSRIPLFLCVDEEGGKVSRLANHPAFSLPRYKSTAAVGESGDPEAARQMGDTIGDYLHGFGFNVDFAPVADVNTNPRNPIIGQRAFSSDAQTAAQMARAMADGLAANGVMPVFKHFPGHGDTRQDSHREIAVANKTQAEMEGCEWLSFCEASAGEGVMVGHVAAPQITGDMTPATLSRGMVTDILKNQLGFSGLVITDSLSMGAITESYSPAEAAVQALLAGCDILLMPGDYRQAFDGVLAAVEDGTIPQEMLDKTVLCILACKQANGIL